MAFAEPKEFDFEEDDDDDAAATMVPPPAPTVFAVLEDRFKRGRSPPDDQVQTWSFSSR